MSEILSFVLRVAITILIVGLFAWRNKVFHQLGPSEDSDLPQPIFGFIRYDCYDAYLGLDFFSDLTCLQYSFLQLTGMSILVAAVFLKMPQMTRILRTQSVEGISVFGAYSEVISYVNTCSYARHIQVPLRVYRETIFISIQNVLMVSLIWTFSRTTSRLEKAIFTTVAGVYIVTVFRDQGISDEVWTAISSSTICFSIFARAPQIYLNYVTSSTGQLAFGTVFLQWFISTARTLIVFMETGDFMYRLQYSVGTCFVTVILAQVIFYNYIMETKADDTPIRRQSTPYKNKTREASTAADSRRTRSPRSKSRSKSPRRKELERSLNERSKTKPMLKHSWT